MNNRPSRAANALPHVWLITKDDFRLLRKITEQDMGPANHQTTMDFYDFNQPLTIELPEVVGE